MKARVALIGLLALGLASTGACSKRFRIEVQSDVCWAGKIDNDQIINDCGNATYKVVGSLSCVKLQKQSVSGYLRVRVDGGPWSETTDPSGIVQACR